MSVALVHAVAPAALTRVAGERELLHVIVGRDTVARVGANGGAIVGIFPCLISRELRRFRVGVAHNLV